MPKIPGITTRELRHLLLRMGFVVTRRNNHWRLQHPALRLNTKISFGAKEIHPILMGDIVVNDLRMTVAEFQAARRGDIPERFTNPDCRMD